LGSRFVAVGEKKKCPRHRRGYESRTPAGRVKTYTNTSYVPFGVSYVLFLVRFARTVLPAGHEANDFNYLIKRVRTVISSSKTGAYHDLGDDYTREGRECRVGGNGTRTDRVDRHARVRVKYFVGVYRFFFPSDEIRDNDVSYTTGERIFSENDSTRAGSTCAPRPKYPNEKSLLQRPEGLGDDAFFRTIIRPREI